MRFVEIVGAKAGLLAEAAAAVALRTENLVESREESLRVWNLASHTGDLRTYPL